MTSQSEVRNSKPEVTSRVGKFIQTYHSFLSTFVIGAAGLIATSIWQYKQSEIARRQAESQQKIAQTQADNSWRIERAEILSKNLQVLASSGEDTVEQRYGVLLSLTRGSILDAELAVSYALELGKDNAEYMKSVLSNTADKSYARLATAYELTCEQRYGLAREVLACKADTTHAKRSAAIADLFEEDTESARKTGKLGPAALLLDERDVQATPARMSWLFTPYLSTLYERRQWQDIAKFEAISVGSRLVAALVLGPSRRHELVAASEAADLDKFHDKRVDWLISYVTGPTCDPDCKTRLTDMLLTFHSVAMGRFDQALLAVLRRPRAEVSSAVGRIDSRLLNCQVVGDDLPALRDAVLVPALAEALKADPVDPKRVEELLSLLVLVPDPTPAADGSVSDQLRAWTQALDASRTLLKDQFRHTFVQRRAFVENLRRNPPPAQRPGMFCSAAEVIAVNPDFAE
ncbi:MAG TPA: hypothetical protein VJV78_30760 [Polyangiales bacterium]|nr:hypothetical protein [Polyangiales bacterium]